MSRTYRDAKGGQNKGEIMQDLNKARKYVNREIERLQEIDS